MALRAATVSGSTVISLTVGESGLVTEADQLASSITITGTLGAALPTGDLVDILLPSGVVRQSTVGADGTSCSLVLTGTDTLVFGVPGQVLGYVTDASGNASASFSQSFGAASARTAVPVSSTLSFFLSSGASALALSGDGRSVAFVANQVINDAVQFGLYVERLDTGTVSLVDPNGRTPSLSADGTVVTYLVSQNGIAQVFQRNFATGLVSQLSDGTAGATSGLAGTGPSTADDGTVVYQSAGDAAQGGNPVQQIYVARATAGLVTSTPVSVAAAGGAVCNGASQDATISADGSTIVFSSAATNLLATGDPHAGALNGSFQIYAKALRDNPVTGQRRQHRAGQRQSGRQRLERGGLCTRRVRQRTLRRVRERQ